MRGGLGAVFAHKGLLDVYAFYIVLADGGDELHIRVLNENIVRGIYKIPDVYRIAHAGDYPRFLGTVVAVDIIAGAHARQQLDRTGVFRHFILLHVSVEPRLILSADVLELKRRLGGYGQVVNIIVAVFADEVNKPQYRGV